jgi:branched-chain amino acid transport system permease protein
VSETVSRRAASPARKKVAPASSGATPTSRFVARRRPYRSTGALLLLALATVLVPVYVPTFWLQALLLACAAAIGALGLDLQAGHAGQLSLGHAAFVAVGAYGYSYLAADVGLPPVLALVAAVALSALVGACFSPVAGRVRGIQLGVASLGLVYLAQYVLLNGGSVTGEELGRSVPAMSVGAISFDGSDAWVVLGVPFGQLEMLWLLVLPLTAACYWTANNLGASQTGVSFRHMRDHLLSAACLGVDVRRTKAQAFILSASYAGLAGSLTGLIFTRIVPDYFGLHLSVSFLFMTVIAGMASSRSAVIGAFVVILVGQALIEFAGELGLSQTATGGMSPAVLAEIAFAIVLVVVLLFGTKLRQGVQVLARRMQALNTTIRSTK